MSQEEAQKKADVQRRINAAQRLMFANEASEHLLRFTQYMMPDPNDANNPMATRYSVCPHNTLLAEALEEVAAGKNLRLIISMPPQHGKSELVSRKFPAWFMGKYPWRHIIHATYSQDFAETFGDDVRNTILSTEYGQIFHNVTLRKGSKAKDHLATEQGGKVSFIGRGGAGTGKPADLFIIDDPIKDAKEAESATIRNDIWEWFTKVAYTRCHVASAIVIVMTRWHEDDLVGRLTDPTNSCYDPDEAKKWVVLNIPAILTEQDAALAAALGITLEDGRAALWPERFPIPHLESARRLNPLGFSALYMGKPTPPEGAFFKRDQFRGYRAEELPKNLRCYGTADLAVSTERDRDKTAILNWGLDEDDTLWLLPDCYWGQANADASVETIIDYAKKYEWMTFFWEKGVIARAVEPLLTKRMMEEGAWVPVEALPTVGNKAARANAFRGRIAMGKIRFPKFAPWWSSAFDQFLKFTGSGDDKEDDFVDAAALIASGLNLHVRASKPKAGSNVIAIGSLKWVKESGRQERRVANMSKKLRGF